MPSTAWLAELFANCSPPASKHPPTLTLLGILAYVLILFSDANAIYITQL